MPKEIGLKKDDRFASFTVFLFSVLDESEIFNFKE